MSESAEIRVPDIGDFTDVPIIEVHVSPGDRVEAEDPLITLESDKATMDVPSPAAGPVNDGELAHEGDLKLARRATGRRGCDRSGRPSAGAAGGPP